MGCGFIEENSVQWIWVTGKLEAYKIALPPGQGEEACFFHSALFLRFRSLDFKRQEKATIVVLRLWLWWLSLSLSWSSSSSSSIGVVDVYVGVDVHVDVGVVVCVDVGRYHARVRARAPAKTPPQNRYISACVRSTSACVAS